MCYNYIRYNMKIKGLTIQEKKAADHYLEYGQKANAIRHAYNIGKKGGSKTEELEKITVRNMGQQVFSRKNVSEYIEGHATGAASRVVDLSKTADSDAVRLNANKDILDRAGFKPKEVSEVEVKKTYDEEQIQRAIKEIQDKSASDGGDDGTEGKE
jgi:phosphoribosyl-AMP cyclohydrolase